MGLYIGSSNVAGGGSVTDSSVAAFIGAGGPTDTALSATYARSTQVAFRASRRWLFLGDSITNGSNASNFAYSFTRQACHMAGTLYASADSIEAGTPGATAADVLAALPGYLATYPDVGALHLQIGTNDAGAARSLAAFQANVQAILNLCKAHGIPMTIGTVPARSAAVATDAIRNAIAVYNMWIRTWASGQGVEVAEVYGALVDSTTGDMLATYDGGDGVHPTTAGHTLIARAVASAIRRCLSTSPPAQVFGKTLANLAPNPLMTGAGANPDTSYGSVATGTAPTTSIVADTTGLLPAGRWAQIDLDAAAASSYARAFTVDARWAVGDSLAICGMIQVEDVTGGGAWDAAIAAGTATVNFIVINGSTGVGVFGAVSNDRCAGRKLSDGTYFIGPTFMPFAAPSGAASLVIRYSVSLPAGLHVRARFGALGVLNLTTLQFNGGAGQMVNL